MADHTNQTATRVDTIERDIVLSHPIERVWRALTEAEDLSRWFGDSAEVDLRPGGTMRVGWSDYGEVIDCVVETVEPPRRFVYRWSAGTDQDGTTWMTTVDFTLEEIEEGTRLVLVESGLAELPSALYERTLRENTSGWDAELTDLRQHLDAA